MTEYDNDLPEEEEEGMEEEDSILDIDTSGCQEPICVEDGEYKIAITGFKKDTKGKIVRVKEETGNKFFITTLECPDEEFSKGFSKILSLPTEDMDAKRLNSVKWELECFKKAFGLDELNFNTMIGKTAYAILYTKPADGEYAEKNEVRKFILGA